MRIKSAQCWKLYSFIAYKNCSKKTFPGVIYVNKYVPEKFFESIAFSEKI